MKIFLNKIVLLSLFVLSTNTFAGFYSSDYFEPVVGCAVLGFIGYSTASDSSKMTTGAAYCVGGIVIGNNLQTYYRKKIDVVNKKELEDYKQEIDAIVFKQARSVNLGESKTSFMLELEQAEPQQQLPDGSVISPTIRTIYVSP